MPECCKSCELSKHAALQFCNCANNTELGSHSYEKLPEFMLALLMINMYCLICHPPIKIIRWSPFLMARLMTGTYLNFPVLELFHQGKTFKLLQFSCHYIALLYLDLSWSFSNFFQYICLEICTLVRTLGFVVQEVALYTVKTNTMLLV